MYTVEKESEITEQQLGTGGQQESDEALNFQRYNVLPFIFILHLLQPFSDSPEVT